MKKNSSVVFKLSFKFAAILTAAMILIIFTFFMLLRDSARQQEIKAFNRTLNMLSRPLERGDQRLFDKKLSELPFFITYVVYNTETKEIYKRKNDKIQILPPSPSKIIRVTGEKNYKNELISYVYMTKSIISSDGTPVTIQIAQNANFNANRFITDMLFLIGLASIPILLLSYFISLFITKKTMQPVVRITKAAQSISSTNLDKRLPTTGKNDELDNLASTFNDLFTRLKSDFDQERSFTGNVSHELKTPVAVILGQANLLRRWGKEDPQQLDKSINTIIRETRSMESIISNLLQLSRLESGKTPLECTDVNIKEMFMRLKEEFTSLNQNCQIKFEDKDFGSVYTDSELLHQVFTAVISNSLKFVKDSPIITLNCNQDSDSLSLTILDNGPGFREEIIPHVFERFYRGDASHNRSSGGSGLGLSICQAIMTVLKGTITASNGENGGALITISLSRKPVKEV